MEIDNILTGKEYIESFVKKHGDSNGLLRGEGTVEALGLEKVFYFVDADGCVILSCHEDRADEMLERLL